MSQPLALEIIRDFDYVAWELLQVEVDSSVQADRVLMWDAARDKMGFGYSAASVCGFGFAEGLAFGQGIFGGGWFGQGAEALDYDTLSEFVSGDYAIRLRGLDPLGNAGSWSTSQTLAHRPAPPAVTAPQLTGSTLSFTWAGL